MNEKLNLIDKKKWLKLVEVKKLFKCGYKDLMIKISNKNLELIQLGNDIYFFRDDLEKVFEYKSAPSN